MDGVREQFVDDFLVTCSVEIFSPGEEVLTRGTIASHLYLLVGGTVRISPDFDGSSSSDELEEERILEEGEFINETGFFTDTPQADTIRTKTVCKMLTISRSSYKLLAEDHPGSVSKILENLLKKIEGQATKAHGMEPTVRLSKRMEILKAGSAYDVTAFDQSESKEFKEAKALYQIDQSLTEVKDLIKMHMNKLKDDHTTRFLFAASRGDVSTISVMCEHGFDANSADYDFRTALMVSAMKGNTAAVQKILEFGGDPNLVDVHGTSALYEAARNGHEDTMNILLEHGAKLCMSEGKSASTLCQAVFDGDVLTLRRLLRAKINPDAGDYDKRTAAHIAAAEGNTAAMKVLVEFGANLEVRDRWNNSLMDEANSVKAGNLIAYLKSLEK